MPRTYSAKPKPRALASQTPQTTVKVASIRYALLGTPAARSFSIAPKLRRDILLLVTTDRVQVARLGGRTLQIFLYFCIRDEASYYFYRNNEQ